MDESGSAVEEGAGGCQVWHIGARDAAKPGMSSGNAEDTSVNWWCLLRT